MKTKNFKTPEGEQVACIFVRVYGVPMWIESRNIKVFKKNAKRSNRLVRSAEKAIHHLERIQKMVDAISETWDGQKTAPDESASKA